MDRIADMGGREGLGAVAPPRPDEPVFGEAWEGRAFALTLLTMGRVSGRNLDAFRHALERLDESAYLDDGYYGRWLNAAELMLLDSAILAPGAVDARARILAGEDAEEPAVPEPDKPDYAATAPGSLRTVEVAPAFAVGDTVRAKEMSPAGHTKLPAYVRGHTGVVELIQPAHLFPDTHAHFLGENPQHVYSVRFDSRELWGPDAETFSLTIELFESYLEPAP
ncbi:nitrile hydratase subunit beta [Pseudonocardia xishanensis]|uniref:Nitrile hydratase subunit beta n=1 Tax=Pseudonocardia xishanensis TaxID=630995 RepID=A0ABP8RSG2_9PSEU